MFNTILVAVDESEASREAFELSCKLAHEDRASLVLLNVVDVSKLIAVSGYDAPYPAEALDIMRNAGQKLLEERKAACAQDGITATTAIGEGDAVDEILRAADQNDAGLICMGTHGRQGLARLFIGSVAEGVLRKSEVPVLVVRPTKQA
jgi:nucleotide-binding universal stress UspA family protein